MIIIVLFLLIIALAVIVFIMNGEIKELKLKTGNNRIALLALFKELEVMVNTDGVLEFTNPNKDRL